MANLHPIILALLITIPAIFAAIAKDNKPTTVAVHATNRTSVPSASYIVDACEFLKEAYSIYADDESRAKLYKQLFTEKHPENQWNVVSGYTACVVSSKWYVETEVVPPFQTMKDNKSKKTNFFIFSSPKDKNSTVDLN